MSTHHGLVRDDLLSRLRGWQKDAYHEYFSRPRRDFLLVPPLPQATADQVQARIATLRRWAISAR